jgi:hypothetical protein
MPNVKPPDENCIARGAYFLCQIDRTGDGHTGKVYDEQGLVLRYEARRSPFGFSVHNPFNKRDFVFICSAEQHEIVIRRHSFLPPVFHIINQTGVIGDIRLISPLRNKYSIAIEEAKSWVFHMPVFTTCFNGSSEGGTGIWVTVGASQMEWLILIRPGIVNRNLLLALAFIHNERWHYG